MTFPHAPLAAAGLDPDFLRELLDQHEQAAAPRLGRLWDYYRNETDPPADDSDARPRPAQSRGLPRRLTRPGELTQVEREVVIENDIAWRINAQVDFMFGKQVGLKSTADDPELARTINDVLSRVIANHGGVALFQDMALLGAVYGHIDLLLRADPGELRGRPLDDAIDRLSIDLIEAPRAVPVLHPNDYRRLDAYLVHYRIWKNQLANTGWLDRLNLKLAGTGRPAAIRATSQVTEVWTAEQMLHFEGDSRDRRLIAQRRNPFGVIPLVHIQNLAQPLFYEGLSDVEPLIPLQDELNTRLSDRANRVTFQSFKMYLGKGIDTFDQQSIGPGQMWATDNLDATIEQFGGDGDNPSETAHIGEIREAMDKASGVTPIAAGLLRNKVGNLTSENALRIVMMGMLSRTEKKRVTYGQGITRLCELILRCLDLAGVLPTRPDQRGVRIDWPTPIPDNESQSLRNAQLKLQLGVPQDQVLAELGYTADAD